MFTAMLSERGCAICKEAAAEYHILANSIRYTGSQENGYQNKNWSSPGFDGPEPVGPMTKLWTGPRPKGLNFNYCRHVQ